MKGEGAGRRGPEGPALLEVEGPLDGEGLAALRRRTARVDPRRGVVLDLSRLTGLDGESADRLLDVLDGLVARGCRYALRGVDGEAARALDARGGPGCVSGRCATCEEEVARILGGRPLGLARLLEGVARFRSEVAPAYAPVFRSLAGGQRPHTLFITCSDSRIDPNLITCTEPGELFILRNVGNLIPPFGRDLPAEGAAIEFAVGLLEVREVVVCGHSGCGAMKALLEGVEDLGGRFPSLAAWLDLARGLPASLPPGATVEDASRANALAQLASLLTYPAVRQGVEVGRLRLHAWHYDIGGAELEAWDREAGAFRVLPGPSGARP